MEVECSVLGNLEPEASVPGEIVIEADWYDYEAKYERGRHGAGGARRGCPTPVRERVRALAVDVFRRAGCAGHGALRLLRRGPEGDGRVLVNELNTIPGFTATSVYAKLLEATGVAYRPLLDRLLELARRAPPARARLPLLAVRRFSSCDGRPCCSSRAAW